MKKLATALAAFAALAIATPAVFACPGHDKGSDGAKTADKTEKKDQDKKKAPAKKDGDKKDTDTAKKKETKDKDKVSMK